MSSENHGSDGTLQSSYKLPLSCNCQILKLVPKKPITSLKVISPYPHPSALQILIMIFFIKNISLGWFNFILDSSSASS